ncbi:MAG: SprT family zinc-dependent metalloprotease [Chloroflexota bacterium]
MPIAIDKLVRSRRRTIAIVVERDGRLTVRAPLRMAEKHIHEFVESHVEWIARNQAKVRAAPLPQHKQYAEGEMFLYMGKPYPLRIVPPQRPALKFDGTTFRLAKSAQPRAEQVFVRWYKVQALEVISGRVQALAGKYGFSYQKIRISSARTRWGSCSSRGTLSFTYRLVMAPPAVVDYVVIHELVHTKIKNHSKTFWARVGEILPEYKTHVRWLKKNGQFLM